MMSNIVATEDLMRITKLTKPGDIERVLSAQGIKVFRGRKGAIWTTMDLINQAGGITTAPQSEDAYDAEALIG